MLKQEKNKIFLSIAIPTWNRYEEVVRAIESIPLVNYNDVEIIVCDNNSEKNISELLRSYCMQNPKIKFFENDTNIGMTKNWNKALKFCSGEWISLLCSDDIFQESGFDNAYNTIQNNKNCKLIIQNPSIDFSIELASGTDAAKKINLPIASGNFWHKECILQCGLFDERLKYSPDGEYWIRLATKFNVLMYSGQFAKYYMHSDNYMWQTWLGDDIIEQMILIDQLINIHKKEVSNINLEQRKWGTYLFFLFSSIGKSEQVQITNKYLPLLHKMAVTNERKFQLVKLYFLYTYRKCLPLSIRNILKRLIYNV